MAQSTKKRRNSIYGANKFGRTVDWALDLSAGLDGSLNTNSSGNAGEHPGLHGPCARGNLYHRCRVRRWYRQLPAEWPKQRPSGPGLP
jgi:hypothetical protein